MLGVCRWFETVGTRTRQVVKEPSRFGLVSAAGGLFSGRSEGTGAANDGHGRIRTLSPGSRQRTAPPRHPVARTAAEGLRAAVRLARRPGQLANKNALLDAVWGHRHVSESVLKSTVNAIRASARRRRRPAALHRDDRAPRLSLHRPRSRQPASGRACRGRPPRSAQANDSAPQSPLIGRSRRARAARRARRRQPQRGEKQLVWVAGEAGIGKTTLIDRFAARPARPDLPSARPMRRAVRRRRALPSRARGARPALPSRWPSFWADALRQVAPTWLAQMPWLIADTDRAASRRARRRRTGPDGARVRRTARRRHAARRCCW